MLPPFIISKRKHMELLLHMSFLPPCWRNIFRVRGKRGSSLVCRNSRVLLWSVQRLSDDSSFPLWITFSLVAFLLLFCTFPWLQALLSSVNYSCRLKGPDRWKIPGSIYMPHYTVYESEVGECECLVYWLYWQWRNYFMPLTGACFFFFFLHVVWLTK